MIRENLLEKKEDTNPDIDEEGAEMEIRMILQQICQMGAVDSEPEAINKIIEEMKMGKIKPKDAVILARRLEASRQDYH